MLETVVCTISDEGTRVKNELVKDTIGQLSGMRNSHFRVVGVHMGNNHKINDEIKRYCPQIQIIPFPKGHFVERMKKGMNQLFVEAKRSVARALQDNPGAVLYMEGDKSDFVPDIKKVVYPILENKAEVVIATRSKEGYAEFPLGQRFWETTANMILEKRFGEKMDLMYGPRAWSAECAQYFSKCSMDSFGALTYSVMRAQFEAKNVIGVEVDGRPQESYMSKYPVFIRIPGLHFLYRATQNKEHIIAADLAQKEADLESL